MIGAERRRMNQQKRLFAGRDARELYDAQALCARSIAIERERILIEVAAQRERHAALGHMDIATALRALERLIEEEAAE